MSKSKILEALALVGLYPGYEFKIAGSDTVYYIDKDYGIFTKNNDVISNERFVTILSSPDLIIKCRTFSQKEKEAFTASRNISFLRTVTAFLPSFFFLFPDRIVVDRFIECFFPALMIIRTVAEKPHGFSCDCLRGHIV